MERVPLRTDAQPAHCPHRLDPAPLTCPARGKAKDPGPVGKAGTWHRHSKGRGRGGAAAKHMPPRSFTRWAPSHRHQGMHGRGHILVSGTGKLRLPDGSLRRPSPPLGPCQYCQQCLGNWVAHSSATDLLTGTHTTGGCISKYRGGGGVMEMRYGAHCCDLCA